MKKTHLFGALFVIIFGSLMLMFGLGLNKDPNQLDLAVKDTKVPIFSLPSLDGGVITNQDLTTDKKYYLINFWGSWCPSCHEEHPFLMTLSATETIYGVNWKDDKTNSLDYLQNGGNPYKKVIIDNNSELAIGMGVYGAPETFLIKADGTILSRYAGRLNQTVWQQQFLPKIKALEEE